MLLKLYTTVNGKKPFREWLSSKDAIIQLKVIQKLYVVAKSVFLQCKPVGDGVFERKLFGIRVYFLKHKDVCIFLLLGGEKDKQQQRDIDKAKEYARDFNSRYTQKDIDEEEIL